MGIHDGHRARKKAQYRRLGLRGMAEHEALELLLYYAIPRRDTNELAHRLIQEFGSLYAVLEAPVEALARVDGMGENAALLLQLVHDVHTHVAVPPRRDIHFNSLKDYGDYAMKLLDGQRKEILYMFCMDDKGKLLAEHVLSQGGVNSATVSVQDVVEKALRCRCSYVVLAHNHPGGVASISRDDRNTTLHLRDVLQDVHIALIEHIIVADGDYVSMALSDVFL